MQLSNGCEAASPTDDQTLSELPVLVLHVNARCNCRCVMCDIWKITDEQVLAPECLESLYDSMKELKTRHVALTGGEPLMNLNLQGFCARLKEAGIRITLLTSGLLLERNSTWLNEMVDEVVVSIDGPEKIHDSIRGIRGAFSAAAKGIRSLRLGSRCTAQVRTTVQRRNHSHLVETADAVRTLGAESISFLAADLTSKAFNRDSVLPIERQSELALTACEIPVLESQVDELSAYDPSGFVVESPAKLRRIVQHFRSWHSGERTLAPLCNAPWTSAVVETNGAVRPCFFHPPIGKLTSSNSLLKVLNSTAAAAFRRTLDIQSNEICQRCVCSLNYRADRDSDSSSPL